MKIFKIFTDGGMFRKYNLAVSAGLITLDKQDIIKFEKYAFNKTSDYAEIFAIKKALSRIYGNLVQHNFYDGNYLIEVYTDSKISINAILSFGTVCTSKNLSKVKLLCEIYDILTKLDNKVVFYHINSHIPLNKLREYHTKFCNDNSVDICWNDFLFVVKQNKKCDNMVKRAFKKYNKRKKIMEALDNKMKEDNNYIL